MMLLKVHIHLQCMHTFTALRWIAIFEELTLLTINYIDKQGKLFKNAMQMQKTHAKW